MIATPDNVRAEAERIDQCDFFNITVYLCPRAEGDQADPISMPRPVYYAMEETLGEAHDTAFTVAHDDANLEREHRIYAVLLAAEIMENPA